MQTEQVFKCCFGSFETENFEMKKNELTRQGFLDLNLMEANDRDGDPWDLWVTLLSLGYNRALEMTEVGEAQKSKNPCTCNCCSLCACHKLIAEGRDPLSLS